VISPPAIELHAVRREFDGDDGSDEPSTTLLLEGAMLRVEADLRWLEVAESRLKMWPEQ